MSTTHTIVMTGASRGIGQHAAARILEQDPGAHLVVVTRDVSRVADTLGAGGRPVTYVAADLGSLASTRAVAEQLSSLLQEGRLPPLRGFVGNAGVMLPDDTTTTPEGLEATFAVNVLANHVLLQCLRERFVPGARVTLTVSDAHFGDVRHNLGLLPGPTWMDPVVLARANAFPDPTSTVAGITAYSTSKLAAIYLVHEWARRLAPGVDVVAFNPGFVPGTGLSRNAGRTSRFLMRHVVPVLALTPIASTPAAAGRHLADAALGTTDAPTGSYVDRARVARSSDESYDVARESALWDAAEALVGLPTR